jgi:hypothetical protein
VSVAWYAGLFWLLASICAQGLTRAALAVRWNWAAWRALDLAQYSNRMAHACAIEAGAEDDNKEAI